MKTADLLLTCANQVEYFNATVGEEVTQPLQDSLLRKFANSCDALVRGDSDTDISVIKKYIEVHSFLSKVVPFNNMSDVGESLRGYLGVVEAASKSKELNKLVASYIETQRDGEKWASGFNFLCLQKSGGKDFLRSLALKLKSFPPIIQVCSWRGLELHFFTWRGVELLGAA